MTATGAAFDTQWPDRHQEPEGQGSEAEQLARSGRSLQPTRAKTTEIQVIGAPRSARLVLNGYPGRCSLKRLLIEFALKITTEPMRMAFRDISPFPTARVARRSGWSADHRSGARTPWTQRVPGPAREPIARRLQTVPAGSALR